VALPGGTAEKKYKGRGSVAKARKQPSTEAKKKTLSAVSEWGRTEGGNIARPTVRLVKPLVKKKGVKRKGKTRENKRGSSEPYEREKVTAQDAIKKETCGVHSHRRHTSRDGGKTGVRRTAGKISTQESKTHAKGGQGGGYTKNPPHKKKKKNPRTRIDSTKLLRTRSRLTKRGGARLDLKHETQPI